MPGEQSENGPGSHINTLHSSFKTPCLTSFKSGWPSIINESMRGHTGFGREEYGSERDILLLPCELVSLDHRKGFLWIPTTAARDRRDPWVVEIVADVNLRNHFGLQDDDVVEIKVPTTRVQG